MKWYFTSINLFILIIIIYMNYKKNTLITSFLAITCIVLLGFGGCTKHLPRIYKLDIEQGNKLSLESVRQIKIGMTQDEVQQLLGTPVLNSIFRKDRLYYIYYHKPAYGCLVKHHLIIHFQDGVVSQFSENYL